MTANLDNPKSQNKKPTRKRRSIWVFLVPRFRLRTILILMTLVCIVLGSWITRSRNQQVACAKLTELGWSWSFAGETPVAEKEPWWLLWVPEGLKSGDAIHYWRSVDAIEAGPTNSHAACAVAQQLPALRKLELKYHPVTTEAMKALGKLSRLTYLDLNYSNINDEGFAHVGNLSRLEHLNIDWISVSSRGFSPLARLRRLQRLECADTKFDDVSLEYLSGLTRLEHLDLTNTEVSSIGFQHLKRHRKISMLYLDRTNVDDGIADVVKHFPLTKFFAQGTKLTDVGCAEIFSQAQPSTIRLCGTGVGSKTLETIGNFNRVEELDLTDTKATEISDALKLANLGRVDELTIPLRRLDDLLEIDRVLDFQRLNTFEKEDMQILAGNASTRNNLSIVNCQLNRDGWQRLANCPTLFELDVKECDLDDEAIGLLPVALTRLSIADCPITDAGIKKILGLTNLECLCFRDCDLSDDGLMQLNQLMSLKTLEVVSCPRVSLKSFATLSHLPNIETLAGYDCRAEIARNDLVELASGIEDSKWLSVLQWNDVEFDQAANLLRGRPESTQDRVYWPSGLPLTQKAIHAISASKQIKSLRISGLDNAGEKLASFGVLPDLCEFTCEDSSLGEIGFDWLAQQPALSVLVLSSVDLRAESLRKLNNGRLKTLSLWLPEFNDELVEAASQLIGLEELFLGSREKVTDLNEKLIADNAKHLKFLFLGLENAKLSNEELKDLCRMPKLKDLSVYGELEPDALDVLVAHGNSLESIYTGRGRIDFERFRNSLSKFPNLRRFWSAGASSTRPGVEHEGGIAAWYSLRSSDWCRQHEIEQYPDPPKKAPFLHPLKLQSPLFDDSAAVDALNHYQRIRSVSASGSRVSARFFQALLEKNEVVDLELNFTMVTDQDLGIISKLARLSKLEVSYCNITDSGIEQLGRGCLRLRDLNLRGTNITNLAFEHLASIFFLKSINLADTQITAAGLRRLAGHRHLREISIGKGQILEDELAELRNLLPGIKIEIVD